MTLDPSDELAPIRRKLGHLSDIARRETTMEGEVRAACNAIDRLCEKHGLWPEDYGIAKTWDFDDYVDVEEIARIQHHFNEGWTGQGARPGDKFMLGYHILSSIEYAGPLPKGVECGILQASRFQRRLLRCARQRYSAGFYADPFTKEPMMRPRVVKQ